MECHGRDLLQAYLDDELDVARTIEMERHVAGCVACADAVAGHRALRDVLSAPELRFTPPPALAARVRTALDTAADAGARRPAPRAAVRPWRWAFSGAAVAFASLLLVSRALLPGGGGREGLADQLVASHVRSLMASHLTDVVSSDRHTVRPWFDGKLDFSPPVKDLAASGFPLIGGRLDYLAGRPVAALVYTRQKHVINVFVWPAAAGEPAPATRAEENGYNLVGWRGDGMAYWAVSDLNAEELGAFAKLVQQP
ncbi:MAG TPA: anti-sigma factor [Candidatus Binatia bacterium]